MVAGLHGDPTRAAGASTELLPGARAAPTGLLPAAGEVVRRRPRPTTGGHPCALPRVSIAALGLTLALAPAAHGGELRPMEPGDRRRDGARHERPAQHAVPGRLPDPVAGRAEPLHGLEPPAVRRRPAHRPRHLGRARARAPTIRGARPRTSASRSTRRRTTSARRRSAAAACSSSAGRSTPGVTCGMGDIYFTPLQPGARLARAGAPRLRHRGRPERPARRAGPLVLRGRRPAAVLLQRPRHLRQPAGPDGRFGPAVAVAELNSAGGGHPAERAQGRSRGRVRLERASPASARTSGAPRARASTIRGRSPSTSATRSTRRRTRRARRSRGTARRCTSAAARSCGPADIYVSTRTRTRGHCEH